VNSAAVSSIVLTVVFGSAIAGMLLRTVLPHHHHLRDDSRDVIKMGIDLVGTMAALVLGLLVASAKGNYDAQSAGLTQISAKIVLFDRVLAHYGPETKDAREALKQGVISILNQMGSRNTPGPLDPRSASAEILYDKIEALSPKDESQRSLKAQALSTVMNLGETRWLMYEQGMSTVSKPLVVVMVFWLTVVFFSWGLLAPPNATLVITILVSALSISGAIFLILEMYAPSRGLIHISDAPLRAALAHLGQ
jgi:hypothetical protein